MNRDELRQEIRYRAPRHADELISHIDAYVAAERERWAQMLDAVCDEMYPTDVFGGPWDVETARRANRLLRDAGLPVYDRVGAQSMRHAYRQAATMLRDGAQRPSDAVDDAERVEDGRHE